MERQITVTFIPPEKWYHRAKWRLEEEYPSADGSVIVPVGFVSDGATIPLVLQTIFSPTGKYFGAAIIHDYLINECNDWERANVEFEKELSEQNIKPWRKTALVTAVKLWGKYRQYHPKTNTQN